MPSTLISAAECARRADAARSKARASQDRDTVTNLIAMATQWDYLAGVQVRLREMQTFLDENRILVN